jgi:Spy/CpxP family protein refolding chaperone
MTEASANGASRGKAIAMLLAAVLLGGAAGAALMRAHMHSDLRSRMGHSSEKSRTRFRVEAMKRRLDLSDDQTIKIEAIFEEMGPERREAMSACKPKLDATRDKVRTRINAVLTPEQQQKHEAFMNKLRERRSGAPSPTASH